MPLPSAASAPHSTPIPIAIIEDEVPFSRAVQAALERTARYRVVATATSVETASRWPARVQPRLVLLDVGLPGLPGTNAIAHLLRLQPPPLVLILTARSEDDVLLEAISAGAVGYLIKGSPLGDVVRAVDDALAGGAPMSPGIARRVLALLRPPPRRSAPAPGLDELTAREYEILKLVADGLADKEIGDRLSIAHATVKNHLANVYGKWAVRSRTEAAVRYVRAST